MNMLNTIKTYW